MSTQESAQGTGPKPLCLNTLSSAVMNIIRQKQTTTFSEVAEIIVNTWNPLESANEKTTRRRVYDVLNVFLAAGLISKENKSIKYNNDAHFETGPQLTDEDQMLLSENESLQKQLAHKVKTYLLFKALIERNKAIGMRPASSVQLPAIFVCFGSDKGESATSLDGKTLEISSEQDPNFYSPVNILENADINFNRQKEFLRTQPQISFLEHAIFEEDVRVPSKVQENQSLLLPPVET